MDGIFYTVYIGTDAFELEKAPAYPCGDCTIDRRERHFIGFVERQGGNHFRQTLWNACYNILIFRFDQYTYRSRESQLFRASGENVITSPAESCGWVGIELNT